MTGESNAPVLITHAQAATLLGCHPRNIAKLVSKGWLTSPDPMVLALGLSTSSKSCSCVKSDHG